jgi:hypothetical protein
VAILSRPWVSATFGHIITACTSTIVQVHCRAFLGNRNRQNGPSHARREVPGTGLGDDKACPSNSLT